MGRAYLLTGDPGVGKTTTVKTVVRAIGPSRCGGFYTEEIRNRDGVRTGFQIVTVDGLVRRIADVEFDSKFRIGRYGVDVNVVDTVGVSAICTALETKEIVVIDEIGPMELFSDGFKKIVTDVLESPKVLLGTIVERPYPWADDLKRRNDVRILEMTIGNRNGIARQVLLSLETSQ
jgi:nucleoside-triphosphatase